MQKKRIILGIDPGSRITGYGVVCQKHKKLTWIASGCIRTNNITDFPTRLKLIYSGINNIISKFQPTFFAIESIFFSKNISSAIKLSQAKGAAIVAAANNNLPVFEYAAKQVKKTVVGNGKAEKSEVEYVVRMILEIMNHLQSDAADALAIAITHCYLN